MAALLRPGLRAAALLAGTPRRAAAAWPGDPESPDPALEEAERFLRQELPEEWPLERLAQGFGVSTDVVRRVLRGRGCPSPRRRLRQDRRALSAVAATPGTEREVRAPDGTLLYRLPRGQGGPGPGAQ
ncbi:neugrin [Empidonax traillii]|uniref:neugrin n=1 Tax=Empidonax traillii TaxID=164674 RepID=UPI000FFDA4CF|nr:neugrin [Empidonax traillii]